MSFPKKFYWGGSVSSFQTEGAWNEGGKGLSIYDVRPTNEAFSDWKVAIDFYHRYKEDIALMKEWALISIASLFAGQELFLTVMMK